MLENEIVEVQQKSESDGLANELAKMKKRVAELEALEAHRKWEESAVYRIV